MVEILAFSIGPHMISWDYLGLERLVYEKVRSKIIKTIHHQNPICLLPGLQYVYSARKAMTMAVGKSY
jgi:hypothetical protein